MDTNKDDLPENHAHVGTPEPLSDMPSTEHEQRPQLTIDAGAAAKVAGIVVAIAYIFATGAVSAPIVALIAIAALFIPEQFPDTTFGDLSQKILGLTYPKMDQRLLESAIHQANAAVRGNTLNLGNIANDFSIWESTSDPSIKQDKKTRLQTNYTILTTYFLGNMEADFTAEDFAGALLPQYVSSGARYLSTLVAYYKHADALEIATRSGFATRQSMVLAQFRTDLASITNRALNSYRQGLQQIATSARGYPRSWDDYNNYRNLVTPGGLDLLPDLQCLDPELYPHGYHPRNLNRKLLSFLDTDSAEGAAVSRRGQVLETERKFNPATAVWTLNNMTLWAGTAETGYLYMIDGLYAAQCHLNSVDGYSTTISQARTGTKLTGDQASTQKDLSFQHNCIGVSGNYWNGMQWSVLTYPATTMTQAVFYLTPPNNPADFVRHSYSFSPREIPALINHFTQSIPADLLDQTPIPVTDLQERLADFSIIVDDDAHKHAYLLSWHHHSVAQGFSPHSNHAIEQGNSRIEQFHAIKAASYILSDSLKVVAGPGFTGGDLVELKASSRLGFRIVKNSDKWFAGKYHVRLWFINLASTGIAAAISIKIIPSGNFVSSETFSSIPGIAPAPDPNNLRFTDLRSFTFPGSVMLTSAMSTLVLELNNLSLATPLIVDRIELIFDQSASDPVAITT